ncbi:MAG: carboxyl-terminal processing protease [Pirellulaceae bacterium]|nr:MAG: carboxyl-terminal processing protease [Pirellulaceae bacterium]
MSRILCCAIVATIAWFSLSPQAQGQGADQRAVAEVADVDLLLREGMAFERQRDWVHAVQHYERAVRLWPQEDSLRRRLIISRLHYDVGRRLGDASIRRMLLHPSPAELLELYTEILARIEMSYVEPVELTEVIRGGTAYLEVALTEPEFVALVVPKVAAERLERFRTSLHRLTLANKIRNRFEARGVVERAVGFAEQEVGLPRSATIMGFVLGAVALLDPYSAFLSAAELQDVESQIEGNFVGLGVALQPHEVPLRILNVIPGGPAAEAGLRKGDRILEIGAVQCAEVGAARAADLLRGPEGTSVRLLLQREGDERSPFELILTRRRVEVPSVENVSMLDPAAGVAYLKISSFQKTTADELDRALWRLHRQGMQSLIIDLRGNPGGWLDAAVAVADRFLDQGGIVTTRGKNGLENHNYTAQRGNAWTVPLFLLIDQESASASEILAGALRDNGRALLIGETSYGKGSVQGLFHTRTLNCGLRLTVSKFYSPSGRAISMQGVDPNINVPALPETHLVAKVPVADQAPGNFSGDRVLQVAVHEARTRIAAGTAAVAGR